MMEEGATNGLTPKQRESLTPRLKLAIVNHITLAMMVLMYGGMVFFVAGGRSSEDPVLGTTILVVFIIASVISVPAAFFLYGWLADPMKMARASKPDDAANKWVTGVIVRACLFETVAIYGLMLVLLGANPNVYAAFGGPVFLLFLFTWPTASSFEERFKQGQDLLKQES